MHRPSARRARSHLNALLLLAAVAGAVGALLLFWPASAIDDALHATPATTTSSPDTPVPDAPPESPDTIQFPRPSWSAASLAIEPARHEPLSQIVELTGTITFNEDHLAHIYPLVEGRVDTVHIRFGEQVQQGQLLVVVQSKEVGQSMLRLFQDRLQHQAALRRDQWTQDVTSNTREMIARMREDAPLAQIQEQMRDRPMGEYRETLMTAYIAYDRAQKQSERLAPLSDQGAVPRKELLAADAERDAARATLQSLLEQIQQDIQQRALESAHTVRELETRVSVGEAELKILGFTDQQLAEIDPTRQGESISHYPILSPFDGTVVSKDVVLLERVSPEQQILRIADLSTVWVTTNVYEEQLALLEKMADKKIQVRSAAWPERTFEAEIFYTGDVVDPDSRTVAVRAVAENTGGMLKPGMFVNVLLPLESSTPVVQVPRDAVLEHAGESFVFVHLGQDRFQRREVTLGRREADLVEVTAGLQPQEPVVVSGGFALKSQLLAELLEE